MEATCVTCGARLGTGPFCGDCGAWNGEGEPPPPPGRRCPLCGTLNPARNIHCENCAFRLDRQPLLPEPPPYAIRRITLGVLAILGVLGVILVVGILFDGEGTVATEVTSTTEAATTSDAGAVVTTAAEAEQLVPSTVIASTSFSELLGPQNLVDGDPATYWNDASLHGEGAELVFEFDPAVAIERLVIQNVVDEVAFRRNYRIQGYEIIPDDLSFPVTGELTDTRDAQTIELTTTATTRLTLRVTSTVPAETVEGQAPFEELAVAEVTVFGRPSSG